LWKIIHFFSDGNRIWTQGFVLAKQALLQLEPFCSDYFGDGISQAIYPGWPHAMILLISASHVARVQRGVSHWCPLVVHFLFCLFVCFLTSKTFIESRIHSHRGEQIWVKMLKAQILCQSCN
jgi:hypothetical protein